MTEKNNFSRTAEIAVLIASINKALENVSLDEIKELVHGIDENQKMYHKQRLENPEFIPAADLALRSRVQALKALYVYIKETIKAKSFEKQAEEALSEIRKINGKLRK